MVGEYLPFIAQIYLIKEDNILVALLKAEQMVLKKTYHALGRINSIHLNLDGVTGISS